MNLAKVEISLAENLADLGELLNPNEFFFNFFFFGSSSRPSGNQYFLIKNVLLSLMARSVQEE